jgi:hypothetical protein
MVIARSAYRSEVFSNLEAAVLSISGGSMFESPTLVTKENGESILQALRDATAGREFALGTQYGAKPPSQMTFEHEVTTQRFAADQVILEFDDGNVVMVIPCDGTQKVQITDKAIIVSFMLDNADGPNYHLLYAQDNLVSDWTPDGNTVGSYDDDEEDGYTGEHPLYG